MARFPNGILGGLVGTIGPVVGSSRNGVPYLKSRYTKRKVTNHPDEIANRKKFAAAHAFLHPLLEVVREGFREEGRSVGFIVAKSWVLKNAFEGEGENLHIHPALVKLSIGDLHLPTNIAVKITEQSILEFSWDAVPETNKDATDQAVLVAYSLEQPKPIFKMNGAFRCSGVDRLIYKLEEASTYHVYIWFVSADRSRRSKSKYLGSIDT